MRISTELSQSVSVFNAGTLIWVVVVCCWNGVLYIALQLIPFHTYPLQVPVTTWFDDPNDTELLELIPFFEALDKEDDVVTALSRYHQFQNTPIPMDIQRPLTAT